MFTVDHTKGNRNADHIDKLNEQLEVTVDRAERDKIWDMLYTYSEELLSRTGGSSQGSWNDLAKEWREYAAKHPELDEDEDTRRIDIVASKLCEVSWVAERDGVDIRDLAIVLLDSGLIRNDI